MWYYNSMSDSITIKREVNMTQTNMTFNENLGFQFDRFISDEIVLNGIKGIPNILEMIKDTIDNGDTEDAKMWISEVQRELSENNVRG